VILYFSFDPIFTVLPFINYFISIYIITISFMIIPTLRTNVFLFA